MKAPREGPAEVAYEDVKPVLKKVVRAYMHAHGGDEGELLSFAHEALMLSLRKFDPQRRTPFAKWVAWKVWYALNEQRRVEAKTKRPEADSDAIEEVAERPAPARWQTFVADLGPDAATVVRLVSDPPPRLEARQKRMSRLGGRAVYGALFAFLQQDVGWGPGRIARAFAEVREGVLC